MIGNQHVSQSKKLLLKCNKQLLATPDGPGGDETEDIIEPEAPKK